MEHIVRSELQALAALSPNTKSRASRHVASDSSSSLLLSNSIPRNADASSSSSTSASAQEGRAEAEVDRLVVIEQCRLLKQQLRDAKQKAAPPPRAPSQSDHEDILEGLEREYAAAMAKLQAAHEREMMLSSRVGDLQKKLQAATEQVATSSLRESELMLSLQQTQAQVSERNAQFHAHLEQLRLEAEHEIRTAVGELQEENEELRQQMQQQQQQQQQQDEERQQQLTEISRLKSEALALKTRLQSSEGDEMRQHVMTYEQSVRREHEKLRQLLEAEAARAQRAEDELRRLNREAAAATIGWIANAGARTDHPAASLARLPSDPVGFETDIVSSEGGGATSDTDFRPHSLGAAATSSSSRTEQQLRAEIQRLEQRYAQTVSSMTQERQEALANEAAFTRIARDSAKQLQLDLADAESKIEFLAAFVTSQGHDVDFLLRSRCPPASAAPRSDTQHAPPPDGWRPATPDDGAHAGQSWRLELDDSDDDSHHYSSLRSSNQKRPMRVSSSSNSDEEGDVVAARYVDPAPRPPARRGPHERSPNQPDTVSAPSTFASTLRGTADGGDVSNSRGQELRSAAAAAAAAVSSTQDSGVHDRRLFIRSEARSSMFEKHFFKRSDEQQHQDKQPHDPVATTLKTRRARPLSASRAQHASNTTSNSQQHKQSLQQQQQLLKRMHAGLPTSSKRLYSAPPSPRIASASHRSSSSPASPTRPASRLSSARTSPNRSRSEAASHSSTAAHGSPARLPSRESAASAPPHCSPKRPSSAPATVRAPSVSVSLSKIAVPKIALMRIRALKQLPPRLVPLAEALCILFRIPPDSHLASDGASVSSASDYWRPLRRQLGDAEFVKNLGEFDRMGVTLLTIKKLQRFAEDSEFTPEILTKANSHAADVCAWLRGVYWQWITTAGRKSHSPAARRTGKSTASKGCDAHVSMVLNKQSLCELRSMQQLPAKLHVVCEALCVLMGLQPDAVPDPEKSGAKIGDYWSPLKKRLSDPEFVRSIAQLNVLELSLRTMNDLECFIDIPDFRADHVSSASQACGHIVKWIRSVYAAWMNHAIPLFRRQLPLDHKP